MKPNCLHTILLFSCLSCYCKAAHAQTWGVSGLFVKNMGLSGLYVEPSLSLRIKKHEFLTGPNFLLHPNINYATPYLYQQSRGLKDRFGMHLQYVFYPGKRLKPFEMGIMYKFEYNRIFIYYGDLGKWKANAFFNNVGYKLNYHLSPTIDLVNDLGLGVFSFPLWKVNTRNLYFSLGAKFKIG